MKLLWQQETWEKLSLKDLKHWQQIELFKEDVKKILSEGEVNYDTQWMIELISNAFEGNQELISVMFGEWTEFVIKEDTKMRAIRPTGNIPVEIGPSPISVISVENSKWEDVWTFHFNKKHLSDLLMQKNANKVITLMLIRKAVELQAEDEDVQERAYQVVKDNNWFENLLKNEDSMKLAIMFLSYPKRSEEDEKKVCSAIDAAEPNADFSSWIEDFTWDEDDSEGPALWLAIRPNDEELWWYVSTKLQKIVEKYKKYVS